jgi:hypothetical protein
MNRGSPDHGIAGVDVCAPQRPVDLTITGITEPTVTVIRIMASAAIEVLFEQLLELFKSYAAFVTPLSS